jgi:hypothetical protein
MNGRMGRLLNGREVFMHREIKSVVWRRLVDLM